MFRDSFSYAAEITDRLSNPRPGEIRVFSDAPHVKRDDRLIRMKIPEDMRARDNLGFASKGAVDGRYMPPKAVGRGDQIELTDRPQAIRKSIKDAKMHDQAWPTTQFLWDCHPILDWFADRTSGLFPDHSAPVSSLREVLALDEVAVILHGSILNERGAPVVDRWATMVAMGASPFRIEEVPEFLIRARLHDKTPNRNVSNLELVNPMISRAVDEFQSHLVDLRKKRAKSIDFDLNLVLNRLSKLELRFKDQIRLEHGGQRRDGKHVTVAERRRLARRKAKEQKIDEIFKDWAEWFERTRRMADDPNPHVDVIAVFTG